MMTTRLPVARMSSCGIERVAVAALVLLRQEFHREMNSLQLAPGNLQIARMLGAAGQNDGIELAAKIFDRDRLARLPRW